MTFPPTSQYSPESDMVTDHRALPAREASIKGMGWVCVCVCVGGLSDLLKCHVSVNHHVFMVPATNLQIP